MSKKQLVPSNIGAMGNSDEISAVGFVQLSLLVLLDPDLSDAQKVLYGLLLRFSRQKTHCFPGIGRLAKALGSTERTVQRNMSALEEKGLVVRHRRPTQTNIYDLGQFRDVYGCGRNCNVLKDGVLASFIDAGEDKTVEWIMKGRKLFNGEKDKFEKTVENEDEDEEDGTSGSYKYVDDIRTFPEPSGLSFVEEIPIVSVEKGLRRFENVSESIAEKIEKSKRAVEKKRKRKKDLSSQRPVVTKRGENVDDSMEVIFSKKELTFKDLEGEWRMAIREKFPDTPGVSTPWTGKQYGIVKNLTKQFEADGVPRKKIFEAFVETILRWEVFVNTYGIKGYPTLQLVAGYGLTWFPTLWSGGEVPEGQSKRELARTARDFDEKRATKSEREGGITFL